MERLLWDDDFRDMLPRPLYTFKETSALVSRRSTHNESLSAIQLGR
jgi:hypothetical protein